MGTTYVKYFENKKLMKEFGEKTFKDIIPFDPKTSKYYSKKNLQKAKATFHLFNGGLSKYIFEGRKNIKIKPNALIEFVKFDGNVLRIDVVFNFAQKLGKNEFITSKNSYSYQFLFNNKMVECVNWHRTRF